MPWLPPIVSNVVLASLLALMAWLVQRRHGRHAIAHVLWMLALIKLVTPPLVSLPLEVPPSVVTCALGICGCRQHPPAQARLLSSLPWILLSAWSVGGAVMGWVAWRRWTRFRRLVSLSQPAPESWQTLSQRLAAELSIRRAPEILVVPGRLPPLVVSSGLQPCVLVPMALIDTLSESERTVLLLHELMHVCRGDHVVRIVELLVGVVFWWLPGLTAVGRQLRACEEMCCDAAVVTRYPGARREYARLLLNMLDFTDPLPGDTISPASAMSAKGLEQRLRAILDGSAPQKRAWPAAVLAAALACALMPCGFHYDVARPAAAAVQSLPENGSAQSSGGAVEGKPVFDVCCPCR
jgi:beta-lactamase regulating signal transducer with metallopeptidase domain